MSPSEHTVVSTTSTPSSSSSSIAIGDDTLGREVAGVLSCPPPPMDCEDAVLEALEGTELDSIVSACKVFTCGVATSLDGGTAEELGICCAGLEKKPFNVVCFVEPPFFSLGAMIYYCVDGRTFSVSLSSSTQTSSIKTFEQLPVLWVTRNSIIT